MKKKIILIFIILIFLILGAIFIIAPKKTEKLSGVKVIDTYGNECVKPFVYTCDDTIASLIDLRYDELANKFFFFNAGRQGKINELLNKQVQCRLAEE